MTEGSRPSPKSAMKVVMNSKAIMVTAEHSHCIHVVGIHNFYNLNKELLYMNFTNLLEEIYLCFLMLIY